MSEESGSQQLSMHQYLAELSVAEEGTIYEFAVCSDVPQAIDEGINDFNIRSIKNDICD